ncbi:MAG: 4Fe-4S binding protein [Fibrobacteria bacterium]|nr:4Fe-4S binding protein [Fibrobacteria bacterium]
MPVKVDTGKCTGCGDCVEECPVECLKIENDKCVTDPEECTDCEACVDVCPEGALAMED